MQDLVMIYIPESLKFQVNLVLLHLILPLILRLIVVPTGIFAQPINVGEGHEHESLV